MNQRGGFSEGGYLVIIAMFAVVMMIVLLSAMLSDFRQQDSCVYTGQHAAEVCP